jgi:hypothetical protein
MKRTAAKASPARGRSATWRLLQRAIEQRLQVVATYGGHEREFCPHVLGFSADGVEQALVYQFGGATHGRALAADGAPENWRCVLLAELTQVQVRRGPWHSAANYSVQRQHCVAEVVVAV